MNINSVLHFMSIYWLQISVNKQWILWIHLITYTSKVIKLLWPSGRAYVATGQSSIKILKTKKLSSNFNSSATFEEMGISTLKNETSTLSRNVGHESPSEAVRPPKTTATSAAPLWEAKKWHCFLGHQYWGLARSSSKRQYLGCNYRNWSENYII